MLSTESCWFHLHKSSCCLKVNSTPHWNNKPGSVPTPPTTIRKIRWRKKKQSFLWVVCVCPFSTFRLLSLFSTDPFQSLHPVPVLLYFYIKKKIMNFLFSSTCSILNWINTTPPLSKKRINIWILPHLFKSQTSPLGFCAEAEAVVSCQAVPFS